MKIFLIILWLLNGGNMLVDGAFVMPKGKFIWVEKHRPWANLFYKLNVDIFKLGPLFITFEILWLIWVYALCTTQSWAYVFGLIISLFALWFLPVGTLFSTTIFISLLTMKNKLGIGNQHSMKKLTTIFLLPVSTICFGQRTVQFADSIRYTYNIPEISYAVVNSKSTLEIAALGKHSINLSDIATLDDRFHIGSNTKAMTAFIIAKYVEKGKLKWTTKFFDLFPEWKGISKCEYASITLQDLLSHRAFIQPFQGENDPQIPNFKGTNPEKRKQFGQFVLTLEPVKIDDQNPFVYSNAGYTLATLMLEKVTHKSWEELVENVFNKDLHLNVKFSWPENQKIKDTWGHLTEDDSLKPVSSDWNYHLDYTEPAGDLNITLVDYVKFIQLNLQGLEGKNNYLKSETYKFIHNGIKNYSLGWFNVYENGKELSVHSGTGAFTYFTIVHIDRIKNISYIIFTNSFNQKTQQGVRLLMRKLKENYGN